MDLEIKEIDTQEVQDLKTEILRLRGELTNANWKLTEYWKFQQQLKQFITCEPVVYSHNVKWVEIKE